MFGLPVSGTIVHVPSHVVLPAGVDAPVPVPLRAKTPGSDVPPRQSTAPLLQAGYRSIWEIVSTGLDVDSGGVELFEMPREAGAVWPTTVWAGQLGDGLTKKKACESGASHRADPTSRVTIAIAERARPRFIQVITPAFMSPPAFRMSRSHDPSPGRDRASRRIPR